MSFAFRERGERSKLAGHIKTISATGPDGKPVEDQSLIESAKTHALALLDSLPKEFNGALVVVEGHSNENHRSATVQVVGEKGHF